MGLRRIPRRRTQTAPAFEEQPWSKVAGTEISGRELARDWNVSKPVSPLGQDDPDIDLRPYREHLEPLIARSPSEACSYPSASMPPPGTVIARRV